MPKTVQTQTIEQSLFAVHKNPNFTSYVRVSYMGTTFSVMKTRQNNTLYQTLFVYCVPDERATNSCAKEQDQRHTQSVESESVARVSVQSPS